MLSVPCWVTSVVFTSVSSVVPACVKDWSMWFCLVVRAALPLVSYLRVGKIRSHIWSRICWLFTKISSRLALSIAVKSAILILSLASSASLASESSS